MTSTTIRVSEEMRATLREIAKEEHAPMQTILARAIEQYQWERMMERTNAICAAMTPEAWREEEAERALWDCTLLDGLDGDEYAL